MKQIYKIKSIAVCALAILANTAVAQNLQVTSNGNPVSNGDVIELPYEFEDYSVPGIIEWYEYEWNPRLEVASAEEDTPLTITLSSSENNDGFELCWPSACVPRGEGESVSASGVIGPQFGYVNIHKALSYNSKDQVPTEASVVNISFKTPDETLEMTVKCLLQDENAVGENFADITAEPEYYTIQGLRVAEPQKGQLLIVRKGSKVTKRIF